MKSNQETRGAISMKPANDSNDEPIDGADAMADQERQLVDMVRQARRVAENAGEFKLQAFDKTLEFLLGRSATGGSRAIGSFTPLGGRTLSATEGGRRLEPDADAGPMADSVERLKAADPEKVAEWVGRIEGLPSMKKVYGVLALAHEHGIDRLEIPEVRGIVRDVLRIGIPDGTIRSALSTAPATEISRYTGENGNTAYALLRAGESRMWGELGGQ